MKFHPPFFLFAFSALAVVAATLACSRLDETEGRTASVNECSSSDAAVRTLARVRGWCGCPDGSASCDRTFNDQAGYVAAGQPRCTEAQIGRLALSGVWTHPISEGAGNTRNWGGGGTAAAGGHEGWDYIRPDGTQVRAASAGKVVYIGQGCTTGDKYCGNAWGNHVVVRHGGETFTRYAHLTRQIAVSLGQDVAAGQLLGVVGATGATNTPHVHFEIVLAPRDWFAPSNPRNATCVADPGIVPFTQVPTISGVAVPTVTPTPVRTPVPTVIPTPVATPLRPSVPTPAPLSEEELALRRNARNKSCVLRANVDGVAAPFAEVWLSRTEEMLRLPSGTQVLVRYWVGEDRASIQFSLDGVRYGVAAQNPAFVHASQLDLRSCR